MSDRPIIFSAPMVRALIEGRKTQTRRVIKKPGALDALAVFGAQFLSLPGNADLVPYAPGDRLYVREAFNVFAFSEDGEEAWPLEKLPTAAEYRECKEEAYRFDVQPVYRESDRARKWFASQPWRSPIHMPRWASRLTLTVTDVGLQRLQEISEADAVAEGIEPQSKLTQREGGAVTGWGYHGLDGRGEPTARAAFRTLWNSLHGPDAWDANPWVVAVSFTVRQGNIDHA